LATKGPVEDDLSSLADKADAASSDFKVVGTLAYGNGATALYRNGPKYRAFSFTGKGGDQVTIDVTSPNGDAMAWLLDARYHTLASNDDASATDTSSHIELTLPGAATAATYYVLFRDYQWASHYFTVKVSAKPAGTVVQLSPDKCARSNRYVASGLNATPADVALDAYCGELILGRAAPKGVIAV